MRAQLPSSPALTFLSSLAQDFIEEPTKRAHRWCRRSKFLSSLAQDFIEESVVLIPYIGHIEFLSSLAQDFIEDLMA